MSAPPERLVVDGASRLGFAPHVTFRHDATRGRWVVLAPERLLLPDDLAVEILQLIDGKRSVDAIVDDLARRFEAPRDVIADDVARMLQELVDKAVLAP
ncbi:MAG TPA: pyrroloquinoline quinone biosynthesis peptide chaperone PqqD [Stellaceae bacterium]|jgi:pyrroloquinoline quinone biosynthesis protein D|nr:pyrroloquinoline quinone biosynthesis peptide chaperone PqqD [Stellaceae bacterium]